MGVAVFRLVVLGEVGGAARLGAHPSRRTALLRHVPLRIQKALEMGLRVGSDSQVWRWWTGLGDTNLPYI